MGLRKNLFFCHGRNFRSVGEKQSRFMCLESIFVWAKLQIEIYFITKGKVEISIDVPKRYSKNFKKSLQILTKDSVFGELSFFSGLPR